MHATVVQSSLFNNFHKQNKYDDCSKSQIRDQGMKNIDVNKVDKPGKIFPTYADNLFGLQCPLCIIQCLFPEGSILLDKKVQK